MSVPDISVVVDKKITSIGKEMKARAYRASVALKNAELNVLRGQRSGRVYKKPYKKSRYTASAAGEPPAVRTGKLRNSFRPASKTYDNPFGGAADVVVSIETDTNYAGYLEHGTSKMAARPYADRIKEKAKPEIEKIYAAPYNV